MKLKLKELFPGFAVCLIIAIVSQVLVKFVPTLGAALIAIIIGIIIGNTVCNKEIYNKGTKFSEGRLLEYSIVLTGFTLELMNIFEIGFNGIAFIVIQMSFTICIAYLIGKALGFGRKFSLLMGAGNAVCGSSAIATVSPVVDCNSKDKGLSVTIVNITGTALMIILPLLTLKFYNHEVIKTSAMIGGTLQSVGQVIASGKMVSDSVTEMATIFKILRIILMVGVVLFFSRINTSEEGKLFEKSEHKAKVKTKIPWFIIGFFIFTIINSTGIVPEFVSHLAKSVSGQFEIIALAAIGMRVKFADLAKEGPKGLLYGGLVGLSQVTFAFILIKIFF